MPAPITAPRILIEHVYPEIDCGRYAAKRCLGDLFEVWADIFMDGHDRLKAVLSYRKEGEKNWREVPFEAFGNDRYVARFPLEEIGRYVYSIRAWPDNFGTWVMDTRKKREAGQDIALELTEGQEVIHWLLPKAKRSKPLKQVDALLKGKEGEALADALLGDEIGNLLDEYGIRHDEVVYSRELTVKVDPKLAGFSAWYEMVPRSQSPDPSHPGTFRDCEARIPEIRDLGFDILYFTPIHPIGHTFRKGKNNAVTAEPGDPGSMYAIGSEEGGHKAIHPELGTLDDFRQLVQTAKSHGMEVALDLAIQCSPDHPYIAEHPDWFIFRPDGTIKHAENPPKKYQDIVNVDFFGKDADGLWEELRDVVRYWIDQGVTVFRVDNPHTKPFAFWEWLIGSIHDERPDIIFLSEAFTRPKVMYALAKLGFTQSYTYFTWRVSKTELTEYLTELSTGWPKDYFRPNFFPTTPDIFPTHLHGAGRAGHVIRFVLAATLAGNYGLYNGYELCEGEPVPGKEEFLHSEKYEVKHRDWNAEGNIKELIRQVNHIRKDNPAFHDFTNLRFLPSTNEQVIFYGKRTGSNAVFIAVNLDPRAVQETYINLPIGEYGILENQPYTLHDLLEGHHWQWTGGRQHLRLDPETNPAAIFRMDLP